MTGHKVIIHTDVIVQHLLHTGRHPSLLRRALSAWFCYTTVFNVIELFACASNRRERQAVEDVLSVMKVLGMNAKAAPRTAELFRLHRGARQTDLLVAGLARESKLPVFTTLTDTFPRMRGMRIVGPGELDRLKHPRIQRV